MFKAILPILNKKIPVYIEIGALEVFAFKTLKYGVLNSTQTVF